MQPIVLQQSVWNRQIIIFNTKTAQVKLLNLTTSFYTEQGLLTWSHCNHKKASLVLGLSVVITAIVMWCCRPEKSECVVTENGSQHVNAVKEKLL